MNGVGEAVVERIKAGKEARFHFLMTFAILLVVLYFAQGPFFYRPVIAVLSLATLIGWGLALPVACISVYKQWQLGEEACKELEHRVASYKSAFVAQEQHIALLESAFLTQEYVEFRLFQLATGVESLFKVEIELREDEDEEQLSDIATKIATAKKQFWAAHELAKKLGFEVRPKISDYRASPQ